MEIAFRLDVRKGEGKGRGGWRRKTTAKKRCYHIPTRCGSQFDRNKEHQSGRNSLREEKEQNRGGGATSRGRKIMRQGPYSYRYSSSRTRKSCHRAGEKLSPKSCCRGEKKNAKGKGKGTKREGPRGNRSYLVLTDSTKRSEGPGTTCPRKTNYPRRTKSRA